MCKELEDWLLEEKSIGRAEGKSEGREEGKLEDALEMLKDGFPSEKVAKYTKLSKQATENLARQHKLA